MFSSDRPIESEADDLLGRPVFARKLAEAISSWRERDSLVIALCGPWGSGKTSVKNLTLRALNKLGAKGPVVLEFNPWEFSGSNQLHEAFFEELGKALGRADKQKGLESLAKK